MSLNEKQALFTRLIAELITWCFANGYPVIGAELYRTKEQAEIYAAQGKGIKNSNHRLKLALDLFRMKNGRVTWEDAEYLPIGEKWESMHPLCRWGGRFKRRDAVHFSLIHRGTA